MFDKNCKQKKAPNTFQGIRGLVEPFNNKIDPYYLWVALKVLASSFISPRSSVIMFQPYQYA